MYKLELRLCGLSLICFSVFTDAVLVQLAFWKLSWWDFAGVVSDSVRATGTRGMRLVGELFSRGKNMSTG